MRNIQVMTDFSSATGNKLQNWDAKAAVSFLSAHNHAGVRILNSEASGFDWVPTENSEPETTCSSWEMCLVWKRTAIQARYEKVLPRYHKLFSAFTAKTFMWLQLPLATILACKRSPRHPPQPIRTSAIFCEDLLREALCCFLRWTESMVFKTREQHCRVPSPKNSYFWRLFFYSVLLAILLDPCWPLCLF